MGFAADAVADLIAPPPKPAAAKAAPTDPAQHNFDDHLQVAQDAHEIHDAHADQPADPNETAEPAANAEAPTARAADASKEDAHGQAKPEPQVQAQVLVQLIAATGTHSPAADAQEAKPATPLHQAQVTPVVPTPEATVAAVETAPPQNTQTATTKKVTARVTSKDAAGQAIPAQSAGAQTQEVQASATVQSVTQAQATLPASDEGAASVPAIGAPQAAPTHEPKADPRATGKADTASRPAPISPRQADTSADARPSEIKATPVAAHTSAPAATQADATSQITTPPPAPAQSAAALASAPAATSPIHALQDQSGLRAAPAASQVAHEIVRRFDGGSTSFDIRLDPPDLGRVDIRLEVSRDHKVTATVAADSPQALTELVRHARDLEQTLQSAGLELADNGLSFDLRQGGEGRRNASDDSTAPSFGAQAQDTNLEQTAPIRPRLESWRGVRVDMMV